MLSVKEIRETKFSKAMGGYKQEEVDVLLDKIENDYEHFERIIKELGAKVQELTVQIQEHKNSEDSIQSVLLSAQKLADNIVNEAKEKSEQIVAEAQKNIENITSQEKQLSEMFDKKAEARKAEIEQEMAQMLAQAQAKKESIEKATADSVARQKALFDKIKLEIAAFKAEVTDKYKQHIELLAGIASTVPMDPEQAAYAVTAEFDKAPAVENFLPKEQHVQEEIAEEVLVESEPEEIIIKSDITDEPESILESAKDESIFGFVVNTEDLEEDSWGEDEE